MTRAAIRWALTLTAAVSAGMIFGLAGFRLPYCVAAAVITVMLFKADTLHRRENPWFKHTAPYDPSPKRVTEKTSSARQSRRTRVWGSSFEQ